MGYGQCLYRRVSGIYAVRVVVPLHLRARVGQREVHCSTGLNQRELALAHAGVVHGRWLRLFKEMDALDAAKLALAGPWLNGDDCVSIVKAAELFGAKAEDLVQLVAARQMDLCFQARDWDVRVVDDLGDIDREDGAYLWQSVDGEGSARRLSGLVSVWDSISLAAELGHGKTAYVYQLWSTPLNVLPEGGVFVRPRTVAVELENVLARRSDLERIRLDFVKASTGPARPTVGSPHPTSVLNGAWSPGLGGPLLPAGSSFPVLARASDRLGAKPESVGDLIRLYIEDRSAVHPPADRARWKADEADRNKQKLRCFTEFMGDIPLDRLMAAGDGESLVQTYSEKLCQLPAGSQLAKARRETGDAPAPALVDWANTKRAKRLPRETVLSYLSGLSACIDWGIKRGIVQRNPVANISSSLSKRINGIRENEIRESFSNDELNLIFSTEWYRTGRGKTTVDGTESRHYRPYYYWVPLLALYTGGRANELGQLYLSDIKVSGEGIPYIHFRIEQADQIIADNEELSPLSSDKSLKTVNSNREVPLHQKLIEYGFMEYVEALRRSGNKRLFPELRFDAKKGYGLEARKWFNERFLGNTLGMQRNGKKVLHSFRHNFATSISSDPRLDRVKNQLMGHERGRSLANNRYTDDLPVRETIEVVEEIQYKLPLIARFDVNAAMRALEIAANMKTRHAHRRK